MPHDYDDEPLSMDNDEPVHDANMRPTDTRNTLLANQNTTTTTIPPGPAPPQLPMSTENTTPLPVTGPGGIGTNVSSKKRRRLGGPARAAREAAFIASKSHNATEDTQTQMGVDARDKGGEGV